MRQPQKSIIQMSEEDQIRPGDQSLKNATPEILRLNLVNLTHYKNAISSIGRKTEKNEAQLTKT